MPIDYAKALADLKARSAPAPRAVAAEVAMGKSTGFLEIERQDRGYEKPEARAAELSRIRPAAALRRRSAQQAARCMDCGIPFCHQGCPVNNLIPDWNNLVYRDQWRTALGDAALHQQFSRNSPAASARRRARRPARSTSTTIRSPSKPSNARSWTAAGKKAGSSRSWRRTEDRQDAWRWWARARRAWPAPSNWRAPAIASPCSKRATASAGCCATAFPTSRWKSI